MRTSEVLMIVEKGRNESQEGIVEEMAYWDK